MQPTAADTDSKQENSSAAGAAPLPGPSQPCLQLTDRLRGIYRLHVNDGAGPLNGSDTFTRTFDTPPIQKEAADEIERLRRRVADLEDFLRGASTQFSNMAATS